MSKPDSTDWRLRPAGHRHSAALDAASLSADYDLLPVDASQLDLTEAPDVRAYLDQLNPAMSSTRPTHR